VSLRAARIVWIERLAALELEDCSLQVLELLIVVALSVDLGRSIAVDADGSAYVTGVTDSADFPLQNPFQPAFGGIRDTFVAKLSLKNRSK
jgi:hypothetical protein